MPFKDKTKKAAYAAAHQRQWNIANPDKRRLYSARWRDANQIKIRCGSKEKLAKRRAFLNWLKSLPCMDCHNNFPPVCMDFDHVRGEKVADIATMIVSGWS